MSPDDEEVERPELLSPSEILISSSDFYSDQVSLGKQLRSMIHEMSVSEGPEARGQGPEKK